MIEPEVDSVGNPWYPQSGPDFPLEDAHALPPFAGLPGRHPHWYSQLRAKEHLYAQLDLDHRHDVYSTEYTHLDGKSTLYLHYATGAWREV